MEDAFGITRGHVETVHSYTNDQNLIDNFHKGARRGRSAALNMVLTETGAAKAVAKALPQLEGKLTGNAIRVPTPNVSIVDLNCVMNEQGGIIELQGTGEGRAFTPREQQELLALCAQGNARLIQLEKNILGEIL